MLQFVDTYFNLFKINSVIYKFKLPFKTFDHMMKAVDRILILILLLYMNHDNFIISNCLELRNIKSLAAAFIIRYFHSKTLSIYVYLFDEAIGWFYHSIFNYFRVNPFHSHI